MPPLPPLTPEQQQAALAKALATRQERAAVLRTLRDGTAVPSTVLAAVFADRGHVLNGARVRSVILAVPGIGKVKADQIMTQVGIVATRRLGGLGTRQREELTAALS